ncbi:MAG: DUF935 family protein [Chthoniobacterales bacterium]
MSETASAAPSANQGPLFTAEAIATQRRMRFNPLRLADPENLARWHDQFDVGILGPAAVCWDAMCRRDDTLVTVKPQLEESVASKDWGVFKKKGADEKEAARHAACLQYFWDHIKATDAFDKNERGGKELVLKHMMRADSYYYAVQHIIWNPEPGKMIDVEGSTPVPVITATLEYVPLWYFENTTGTLRFLPMGNASGITGQDMNWDGEWMVTVGRGLMFAGAGCLIFKRLTFQDWTIFNERFAQGKPIGQTTAGKDTPQGQAMRQLIEDFNGDQGIVIYDAQISDKPPISVLGPTGTASVDIFERFLDRQDRKLMMMYRGGDMTMQSRGADKGGEARGASLQGGETDTMEAGCCRRIAGAADEYLTRKVIEICFGKGVEPLAYFGLPDMDLENTQDLRESAGFLADRGVKVKASSVADRLGVELEEVQDSDDVLGGASIAQPEIPETAAKATANARLLETVQAALQRARTANGEAEGHPFHGNQYTEQARGERAMRASISEKTDVLNAMDHPTLGAIDFRHGDAGDAEKDFQGGSGVAPIVAKHGEAVAMKIPAVIAHGTIQEGKNRVFLEYGDHKAVLAKDYHGKPTNRWLVTGYEKKESNR